MDSTGQLTIDRRNIAIPPVTADTERDKIALIDSTLATPDRSQVNMLVVPPKDRHTSGIGGESLNGRALITFAYRDDWGAISAHIPHRSGKQWIRVVSHWPGDTSPRPRDLCYDSDIPWYFPPNAVAPREEVRRALITLATLLMLDPAVGWQPEPDEPDDFWVEPPFEPIDRSKLPPGAIIP